MDIRQHWNDRQKQKQEEAKCLQESEAHRKALASVVDAHAKGGQIGAGGAKLPRLKMQS
jgi:hypothetical protein